jgi:hypothetical protein
MSKSLFQGKDICTAMDWIDKNRDKFVGEVYKPMLLLVRVRLLWSDTREESHDIGIGSLYFISGSKWIQQLRRQSKLNV